MHSVVYNEHADLLISFDTCALVEKKVEENNYNLTKPAKITKKSFEFILYSGTKDYNNRLKFLCRVNFMENETDSEFPRFDQWQISVNIAVID